MPVLAGNRNTSGPEFSNEREILYKLFFDMKKDVTELKKMFVEILKNPSLAAQHPGFMNELQEMDNFRLQNNNGADNNTLGTVRLPSQLPASQPVIMNNEIHDHVEVEESLNIMDKEKELIIKALKKHKSKRKDAAMDLGISERTLYRKLKEYDIEE